MLRLGDLGDGNGDGSVYYIFGSFCFAFNSPFSLFFSMFYFYGGNYRSSTSTSSLICYNIGEIFYSHFSVKS